MEYDCLADEIVGTFTAQEYEDNEKARPAFVGGYDKDGNAITGTDKINVNGGAKVTGYILTVKEAYNGKATNTLSRYIVKGDADLVTAKAEITAEFVGMQYATTTAGSPAVTTVNIYTTAGCTTAFIATSLSADTTIYVKKLATDVQTQIDALDTRVDTLENA